ncbi:MAG: hypothetical protein KF869_00280 [Phycisphaeraceae bacterium]|nr:hypothetical protein [Phycisphaeraceae bacterium]
MDAHNAVRQGPPVRLIAANAVLLGALAVLTIVGLQTPAGAQPGAGGAGAAQRGRGDYTMVSGRYQGGTANMVYLLDSANQELLALEWNRNRNEFTPLGLRSFVDDGRRLAPPR